MLSIKSKQQDLISNSKKVSDSIAYLKESTFDLFNIPKSLSFSTYRLIANVCRVKCFWTEKKASKERNNHTKRLNWSFFKEAPYRNPKPVDNLKD